MSELIHLGCGREGNQGNHPANRMRVSRSGGCWQGCVILVRAFFLRSKGKDAYMEEFKCTMYVRRWRRNEGDGGNCGCLRRAKGRFWGGGGREGSMGGRGGEPRNARRTDKTHGRHTNRYDGIGTLLSGHEHRHTDRNRLTDSLAQKMHKCPGRWIRKGKRAPKQREPIQSPVFGAHAHTLTR
jgi:hypothetical protein